MITRNYHGNNRHSNFHKISDNWSFDCFISAFLENLLLLSWWWWSSWETAFLLNVTEKPVFIELFLYSVTHKGNANFCWFSFMMTTRCRWGQQKRRSSRKTAEKSGYTLFFILKIPWIHQRAAAIKIQIWLENEKLAVPEVGFETRVNDGTC